MGGGRRVLARGARGDTIWVSGTTSATADGVVLGVGDPYEQAREAIAAIARALAELGAGLDDVVRTRMYVTDISRSADVLRAHGEAFATARPATAMVEVAALIDPRMLVEIEAVAVALGQTLDATQLCRPEAR